MTRDKNFSSIRTNDEKNLFFKIPACSDGFNKLQDASDIVGAFGATNPSASRGDL